MPKEIDHRNISVVGIPINPHDESQVLMGYHIARDGWEFPGGAVHPGETPSQALVREIKEETGCDVGPFKLLGFMADDPDWLCLAFVASLTKVPTEVVICEEAHKEWAWFDRCPASLSPGGTFVCNRLLRTQVGDPFTVRAPGKKGRRAKDRVQKV